MFLPLIQQPLISEIMRGDLPFRPPTLAEAVANSFKHGGGVFGRKVRKFVCKDVGTGTHTLFRQLLNMTMHVEREAREMQQVTSPSSWS